MRAKSVAPLVPYGTIMAENQASRNRLTSAQIRAARGLLRWSAADLARRSSVSLRTIRRAELAEDHTSLTAANDLAIRRTFGGGGVEFIDENGGGPGVRLRKRQRKKD
jgi:transcriptional regulator with XRE-family HTH domain